MSLGDIKNCIRNIFKVGLQSKYVDEQTIEVEYLGKKQDALHYIPYGLFVKTPNLDSLSMIYAQEGHEDSLIAMITDIKNRDVIDGEVGFSCGIPTLKDRIIFKDTEKIVFKTGDTEGGDFAVRFNELETAFDRLKSEYDDLVSKYNTLVGLFNGHTHGGVEAGSSDTSPVSGTANTGIASVADITPAKILEIEMPEYTI